MRAYSELIRLNHYVPLGLHFLSTSQKLNKECVECVVGELLKLVQDDKREKGELCSAVHRSYLCFSMTESKQGLDSENNTVASNKTDLFSFLS